MANCCANGLNQVFCNAFNKYYNTLYTNGEISKEETNNLLIIDYIRQCLSDDRYNSYYSILLKALRCIANNSCLLDTSWLYDRSIVPKVTNLFVTVLTKLAFTETDPIFSASPAATITDEDIDNWNNPSTSGGLFVINVTYHEGATEPYTIDKEWDDIIDAYLNNQTLVLNFNDTIYLLQSILLSDNYINFGLVSSTDIDGNTFEISTDGHGTFCTYLDTVNLQERLVSGTNIKTINSSSILGNGNVDLLTPSFCPIIEDTRSQATDVNITGTAPFATLAGGQRIVLHFKYANTASPTLQLTLSDGTTTSAYPLYQNYNNGVNALTLQAMPAGSYGEFVFDSTNSRWVLIGKDFNTTYSNTSQADINNSAQGSRLIEPKLLRDNFYLKSEVNNICPIIEDTRSSAVAAITGVAPFSTLVDKQRIYIHFNYGTANSSTLTLTLSDGTTTSAIPLKASYHNNGNYNVGADLKCNAGSYMPFIYDATNSVWHSLGDIDYYSVPSTMSTAHIQAGTSTVGCVISPKQVHDNAYIVEETYSSGSLKANKMYDFGEVTTALVLPDLDVTNDLVSNAMNFWALHFKVGELTPAGTTELSITFPQNPSGIIVDDEPTIKEGDYVEIMITKHTVGNDTDYYASIKVWQAQ